MLGLEADRGGREALLVPVHVAVVQTGGRRADIYRAGRRGRVGVRRRGGDRARCEARRCLNDEHKVERSCLV